MARTTPVSNGWISLVRPPGTILPVAEATISTLPNVAHSSAKQKTAMMLAPIARPIGDGGVSVISSAAGRNAISCSRRRAGAGGLGNGTMFRLADVMDTGLQIVEVCVTPVRADQLIMSAVLDDAAMLERNDPVRITYRREPMSDDEHGPAGGNSFHVLLDGTLAFVIE